MSEEFKWPDAFRSVLIVDADELVLKTLTLQLQDRGWEVLSTQSSAEALEIFRDHPTAVAVVAIDLSDMDGMELAKVMRQQVPNLIVILMTGYPTLSTAIEGLRHTAYDYLVKPFRIEQLMMGIERARREFRLIQENRELKHTIEELQAELERMAQPPEPGVEEPVGTGAEEELPLRSTPFAGRPSAIPGAGSGAIASYERQIRPTTPEAPEEEQTDQPEASDEEGEQPQPGEQ
ncbi:MAG: response regulator [Candidatus Neomarinimicrobiota bacterium]